MKLKTDQINKVVRSLDLFKDLSSKALSPLLDKVRIVEVPRNKAIIRQGEDGHCMYVIIQGRVKVHQNETVLAELMTGDYFGEFSLLDKAPRSMSVSTLEDCTMGAIYEEDFSELLRHHPALFKDLIHTLLDRLRHRNKVMIDEMKQRAEELERLVHLRTSELREQKDLVLQKNKEITSSIEYAKKHQEAILPDHSVLTAYFSDAFVLYMPKDIVAGDFYWFEQKGDDLIVVAADCTGHGVAGALMSMLGVTLLEQVIVKNDNWIPSEILEQLHLGVVEALHQSDNDSNDGMDLALTNFNLKKMQAQFSGANRPLWILRNGEILEMKPDKLPIGGVHFSSRPDYGNMQIGLNNGDRIYLFSDGYTDQFGGEKGKKLMRRRLKSLLLESIDTPLGEQKELLQNYLLNWMGEEEQVDDILVIGLQI